MGSQWPPQSETDQQRDEEGDQEGHGGTILRDQRNGQRWQHSDAEHHEQHAEDFQHGLGSHGYWLRLDESHGHLEQLLDCADVLLVHEEQDHVIL